MKIQEILEAKSDSIARKANKAFWWDKYSTPKDMLAKVQAMSDEDLKMLGGKGIDDHQSGGDGTPRNFQIKIINRELRRRGFRDFEKHMPKEK